MKRYHENSDCPAAGKQEFRADKCPLYDADLPGDRMKLDRAGSYSGTDSLGSRKNPDEMGSCETCGYWVVSDSTGKALGAHMPLDLTNLWAEAKLEAEAKQKAKEAKAQSSPSQV